MIWYLICYTCAALNASKFQFCLESVFLSWPADPAVGKRLASISMRCQCKEATKIRDAKSTNDWLLAKPFNLILDLL